MQYNSESNEQDLISEVTEICDADLNAYTLKSRTRRINIALEEVEAKLIVASAHGWEFGDSNQTSLPTGLKTLVNSQEAYQLAGDQSTTGIDTTNPLLTVRGVSVKNKDGIWVPLKPIHLWELFAQRIDPAEYFKTDGLPAYYEKREDFLILYPAPDNGISVTLASGLKVFYDRRASKFTTSDTTKEPGFASPYHVLLAYKASLPYCSSYKKDRVPMILGEIARLEKGLLSFYGNRAKDERKIASMKRINFR